MGRKFFIVLAFIAAGALEWAAAGNQLKPNKTSPANLNTGRDSPALTLAFRPPGLGFTIEPNVQRNARSSVVPDSNYGSEEEKKSDEFFKSSGRGDFKSAVDDYMGGKYEEAAGKLARFIAVHPKSPLLEEAYYMRAEALYMTGVDKKTLPETIEAFIAATSLYPSSEHAPRAKFRLAEIYFDHGMAVEALPAYDWLAKKPGNKYMVRGLLGRAKVFMSSKLYYEASNELEKVLLFYPKSPEAREAKFKIAEAFFMMGRYADSIRAFDAAGKRWPEYLMADKEALFSYASANLKADKPEKAREIFSELLNIYPDSREGREALNKIADIWLAKGDKASAAKLLGMLARTSPETEEGLRARLKLASLGQKPEKLLSKSDAFLGLYPAYFEPLATYDDVIKKHPDQSPAPEAMYQKALMFYKDRRYAESISVVNEVMTGYPALSESRQLLELVKANISAMIRVYHEQGGNYEVLDAYYKNFDPYMRDVKDVETRMIIAEAYLETGMYTRAAEKFADLANSSGTARYLDRIYYGWGRAAAALGRYGEAARVLEKFEALAIKGGSIYAAPAMVELGGVYENLKDASKATAAYMAAMKADENGPTWTYALYRTGLVQKDGGRYDEALKSFSDVIKRRGSAPGSDAGPAGDAYFQRVDAAFLSKRYDLAVKFVDAALKANPGSPKKAWALYLKSSCLAGLNEDEKSVETSRTLAKGGPPQVYKDAALASVGGFEWKEKNSDLF
ncbi:MAG: tetratricopeptide repeat protein [Nitrospinae bacterium]|nr:tetratricopeptide repeat protein [Nitrospinota bacterium]